MCATRRRVVGKLAFETAAGGVLGDTRIRLLEAIAEFGSLNRAAKAVPLSYKAAWDALDAVNNLADAPLVVRTTGGAHGGGTRLTEHGRRIVALYRAMERSQQSVLDRLTQDQVLGGGRGKTGGRKQIGMAPDGILNATPPTEADAMRDLIRRMAVRTSARNQFVGTVASLGDAGGMVEVRLRLTGGDEIVAAITPESAENMALAAGQEAHALVKAPWVSVQARAPRRGSGRNIVAGTIGRIEAGAVIARLSVITPNERVFIAAMPNALVIERGLREGTPGWAVFSTESVILAVFA